MHQNEIKLCVSCYYCKTCKLNGNKKVYCKFGAWKEENIEDRSILHTPYDFNCSKYEDA